VKYFFDNSISYRLADMLKALSVDAVALREQHPQNIKDIPLFNELRGSDMVYIAADRRQRTRLAEARALKEAGVTCLFMGPFWDNMGLWAQAAWLVAKWPKIDGFVSGAARNMRRTET
jgi:hypothetical protein